MNAALTPPAFLFEQKDGHVELSVAAEAINRVGYRMELPSAGPWTAQDNIKRVSDILVDARHSEISEDFVKGGQKVVTVEARGLPNNAEFAQRVERHENFHARDVEQKVATMLAPWDRAISQFRTEGRKVSAESVEKAQDKFYEHVGGKPAAVLDRLVKALGESGRAFHRTVVGRPPSIETYVASENRVAVYWEMPEGT